MTLVALLTGADSHSADGESPVLADALAELGVQSRVVVWSDAAAMAEPSDLVVVRTTWDYTLAAAEFVAALRAAPAPVLNPVEVIEWNLHKGYLVELADAGVAVVPTQLLRAGDDLDLGAGDVVLKPAVSAGAHGLGRFDAADPAATAHLDSLLRTGDVLVQPFRPEVLAGERSLMYLGGTFSHAVRKVPGDSDFRVQEEHGGVTTPYRAGDDELMLADAVLAQVTAQFGAELLYARVDLLATDQGPLLMELELIEPDLFLSHDDEAPRRLARAIRNRLS